MIARDPLPEAARIELERLGARWHTLPLPRALRAVPALHAQAQAWADECARVEGRPATALPDLGPAVALDQVRVTAYDVARARTGTPAADVTAAEAAALRRAVG